MDIGLNQKDIPNLNVVQGDTRWPPFRKGSFDMIIIKSGGLDLHKDFKLIDGLLKERNYILTSVSKNHNARTELSKYMSKGCYVRKYIPFLDSIQFEEFVYSNLIPYRSFNMVPFFKKRGLICKGYEIK